MKKLSKLAYLLIALVIMVSCEQDTNEVENLNRSNEIEALIQEHEFLSDAIEMGIDVQSYIVSIQDETPESSLAARPVDEKGYYGNYIYVGDCSVMIDNDCDDEPSILNRGGGGGCVSSMNYDIMELMYEVCEEMYEPRRPWERPYDIEREFSRGMYFLTIGWAVRGQCSWSEAADIMACVSELDFEYFCYEFD